MPDALTQLEKLAKAHKYMSGAKDVLDNVTKVRDVAKSDPKDIEAVKKVLGIAKDKYKPLKKFLSKTQAEVLAAVKGGFPAVMDPTQASKARMEKIAKKSGADSDALEKELGTYIKLLEGYEYELRERISFMKLVKRKCELNIKNFTKMNQVIDGTVIALKAVFIAIPEAQTAAGGEILDIMKSGIQKHPQAVANAYKKLNKLAVSHEKLMMRDHVFAKSALKTARSKKAKFLIEDAKAFLKELF